MSKKRPPRKSQDYLIPCPFGYLFRLSVPQDLRAIVGKTEFRYSLRTRSLREAKAEARRMAGELQRIFRRARMRDLTEADIKELVGKVLEANLNSMLSKAVRLKPMTPDEHKAALDESRETTVDLRLRLGRSDYTPVAAFAEGLLKWHDLRAPTDSLRFRQLCHELHKVGVRLSETEKKILAGDYSFEQQPTSAYAEQPPEPQYLLSAVIEQYANEQRTGKNWSPKSEFEVLSCLETLKEFTGDVPVSQIDHARMREYKQALMRLPANRSKMPAYRGKGIEELLAMNIKTPMSTTSVNKYLRWAGALFSWATRNGFMAQNPAEGLKIKQPKRDDEFRAPFTKGDLHKLFHSPEYLQDKHKAPYQFWTSIIGLFTGARLNEICQLYLDDIYQADGIWVFDVNEGTNDKSIKTKAAKRRIPLHPFLVDGLRLPQYVDSLRAKGYERLFPELPHKREGYGTNASKWFAKYRKRCGVTSTGPKKDFHSFRSTVADALKQKGVDVSLIHETLGHANPSISLSRYADPYQPKVLLAKAIIQLDYGIDLSHLTVSRFCG